MESPKEIGPKGLAVGKRAVKRYQVPPGNAGWWEPWGHAPLLLFSWALVLPISAGHPQRPGDNARAQAEIESGCPGQKGHKCLPRQEGGSGVWQVENQRAAQQAGKWEQIHKGGAGDQVTTLQVTLSPQGTAISN